MISFNYETNFLLTNESLIANWISDVIAVENCKEGEINYVFCNDTYLHKLNMEFLQHDTLTDIISFDNSVGKELHGEIYISIDRVKENATEFQVSLEDELNRVIVHGVLHLCGYDDKSEEEAFRMRQKENFYLEALA